MNVFKIAKLEINIPRACLAVPQVAWFLINVLKIFKMRFIV